jgi:hypothetical protein
MMVTSRVSLKSCPFREPFKIWSVGTMLFAVAVAMNALPSGVGKSYPLRLCCSKWILPPYALVRIHAHRPKIFVLALSRATVLPMRTENHIFSVKLPAG